MEVMLNLLGRDNNLKFEGKQPPVEQKWCILPLIGCILISRAATITRGTRVTRVRKMLEASFNLCHQIMSI